MKTGNTVRMQPQSKEELVRVLAQPLIVLQYVIVIVGVACYKVIQLVLGNVFTLLGHGLAWLDATTPLATSGASCFTT